MSTHNTNQPCAWCGSTDTHFQHIRCWEEDERGNNIELSKLPSDESDYTPKEEIWWCDHCDGGFIVPLAGDDYPELPEDFDSLADDGVYIADEVIHQPYDDDEDVTG